MRKLLISFVIVLLGAGLASAQIHQLLYDDCDDVAMVLGAGEQKERSQFYKKLENLRKKMYPFKENDFIALFGKPQPQPAKSYAMPLAQGRAIMLVGTGFNDPKANIHTDFYVIKDVAAVEVHYWPQTPVPIVFYFPTDKDFPKLTKDNLAKRLAWDEAHFKKLLAFFEKRMIERLSNGD